MLAWIHSLICFLNEFIFSSALRQLGSLFQRVEPRNTKLCLYKSCLTFLIIILPCLLSCIKYLDRLAGSPDFFIRKIIIKVWYAISWLTESHESFSNIQFVLVRGGAQSISLAARFCWIWRDLNSCLVQPPNNGTVVSYWKKHLRLWFSCKLYS